LRFSLELPTQRVDQADAFVTADAIGEITRAAAGAGFAAVNVTDHPAPDTRWLDHGGHHALDPFVALSFAASADSEIKLHTNIYVAAYRNPFLGAKLVHSLDVLSGGRLLLGVAAGYLKPEFAALGIDFEQRGVLLDQALEVLEAVSQGGDVARDGPGFHARGVRFRPLPAHRGRPTVWVGGNSRAAMQRAARYDGWAPFHTAGFARASRTAAIESTKDLKRAIAFVRGLAVESERSGPFDVCWSEALVGDGPISTDERCSRALELEAVGVSWMTVTLPGESRAALLGGIDTFGREVIDELRRR